ncbi:MAG: response regulator, partial [Actinomycetes bacterium]
MSIDGVTQGDRTEHPAHVLIVDAAETGRRTLLKMLTPLSCTVLQAASVTEAADILSSQDVRLVIVSADAPGQDGLHTAELIRQAAANPDVRILVQTPESPADDDENLAYYQLGSIDTIGRPVVAAVLNARVEPILALHERTEELAGVRARLSAAEEFAQAIFDTSADAIMLVNQSGVITAINRTAESMFCCRFEDVAGADYSTMAADPPGRLPAFPPTDEQSGQDVHY